MGRGGLTNSDVIERSPQWKHLLKSVKKEEKLKYKRKIKEEYKEFRAKLNMSAES